MGYQGSALLIGNPASRVVSRPNTPAVGNPQFQEQGLRVLAFPCKQLGEQRRETTRPVTASPATA